VVAVGQPTPDGRVCVGAATDVGRHRTHNEDTFLVRSDLHLWAVADGMGGHRAGDVASAMVALSLGNFFEATEASRWDGYTAPADEALPAPARRLAASVRKANGDVHAISMLHGRHFGMGSTVVACHLPPGSNELWIAHVGDSRCYRLRNGRLEQLTRDHSLVNEARLLDPELTEEQLSRLPTNIITRALGMSDAVEVDVRSVDARAGDLFLLCSDGLTGMVSDAEILEALELLDEPEEAAAVLVELANDAGGVDNVTVLLLRVDATPEDAPIDEPTVEESPQDPSRG
jgi:protein phosphatase